MEGNKTNKMIFIIMGVVIALLIIAVAVFIIVNMNSTVAEFSDPQSTDGNVKSDEATEMNTNIEGTEGYIEGEYTKFYSGDESYSSSEDEEKTMENISIEQSFESFMNNEVSAIISFDEESKTRDEYFYESLLEYSEDKESISFEQLVEKERKHEEEYGCEPDDFNAEYNVYEVDGNNIIALRFVSGTNGGNRVYIFANNNGVFNLTYGYESYSRNFSELRKDMTIRGYGSGGAGDSYEWAYYIDGNGKCNVIYYANTMWSTWISGPNHDTDAIDTTECPDANLIVARVGDDNYVSCNEATGEVQEAILKICDEYKEERGATLVEQSELIKIIDDEFKKCGKLNDDPYELNKAVSIDRWTAINLRLNM